MMSAASVFAHSPNDAGAWHTLSAHLAGTATRAAAFAAPFGARELAYTVGWLHDIGKCSCAFQGYLQTCASQGNDAGRRAFPSRDHKRAGAVVATGSNPLYGALLAALVLGHHGGIPDRSDVQSKLMEARDDLGAAETLARAAEELGAESLSQSPLLPSWLENRPPGKEAQGAHARDVEMLFRLVFSALVDADFLDTEAHFRPDRPSERAGSSGLAGLEERFIAQKTAAIADAPRTPVNRARAMLYDEVLSRSTLPRAIHQLAAPTGAGKTMIGLAWALRHAAEHGLRRIVTAVPFITVTDQVAAVYRDLLDAQDNPVVLEHHSQVGGDDGWRKLAAENWDSPVVVTTTVQLFESLFSNRPSAARKLHRLAGSVIIIDEAQALPLEVLEPVVDGLRVLVERFGASVLVMTATQPTLEHLRATSGKPAVSLVTDPDRWASVFVRTSLTMRGPMETEAVAALVGSHERCLCILNTIDDARRVTAAVPDVEVLHLSTMLRPIDRKTRIEQIRQRLRQGKPCRVVSTQLVEAGVDLDFPVVMRAMGPLPSLAQVDGRCNRNGLLAGLGETIIFDLIGGGKPPGAYYGVGTVQTKVVLSRKGRDFRTPATVAEWYQLVLIDQMVPKDRKGGDGRTVQKARESFDYETVASSFRMIDQDTVAVVVPWPAGDPRAVKVEKLLDRFARPGRTPMGPAEARALQEVTVQVRRRLLDQAVRDGLAEAVTGDLYTWVGKYDDRIGLIFAPLSQEDLIW